MESVYESILNEEDEITNLLLEMFTNYDRKYDYDDNIKLIYINKSKELLKLIDKDTLTKIILIIAST